MARFRFCPCCASPFEKKKIGGKQRLSCPACGFIFYQNSKPCVGALIVRKNGKGKDEVLLTKRAFPPHAGTWDVPGGFLENGEDPEAGLKRELMEELGMKCKVKGLFTILMDVYDRADVYTLNMFYMAESSSKNISAADDVSEFAYFPLDRLPRDIVFQCVKDALGKLRTHLKSSTRQ